jgi:ornithine carbamoyltransferase
MRHLANFKPYSASEILEILDKAAEIKADPAGFAHALDRRTLAMIFQKTSTRTRVSFEVAMTELGGHAIFIDWLTSNFVLSGIEYETEYLSRNVSCIMARLLRHEDLQRVIAGSRAPVINGCCDRFHPCQALTDVFTMREHFPRPLGEAKLVYVGVRNNVSNSLTIVCDKLGVDLTLAVPPQDVDPSPREACDPEVERLLRESPHVRIEHDPAKAVCDANFVYTDTWINMEYFNSPEHSGRKQAILDAMRPYQVNAELLRGIDCRIMHDMPIHDGYEITADMVRDPRSIIFEQAANRLHAQKGLLWWLFREAGLLA